MPSAEQNNQIRLGEAVINLGNGLEMTKGRDDLQPKRSYEIKKSGVQDTIFDNANGTVTIIQNDGNAQDGVRPINELGQITGVLDKLLDKILVYDVSTNTHRWVNPQDIASPEIFRNNGSLSGTAPAGYTYGYDLITGNQYYVNSSGQWTPLPPNTVVTLTDLANGKMTINAGAGGTQQTIRPIDELSLLIGSIDNVNDKILLFDASTGNHTYVTPSQLTNDGNHYPILRTTNVTAAPIASEIANPKDGDSASIKQPNGKVDHYKRISGAWVFVYTDTPVVLDGNNLPLVRTNTTANVAPTAAEIPNPINGDSADVYLSNGNKEVWLHNGTSWALVTTVLPNTLDGNNININRTTATANVAPTAIEVPNPINGDSAIVRLSTGTIEYWNYIGGAWVKAFSTIDEVVNVSVTTLPTFPTTTITGGTFSPNTPATTGLVYEFSNGTNIVYGKWDGTQYISSPAPIIPKTFWWSDVAMTILPDGTNDKTETIYRAGDVNIGNNASANPTLRLHSSTSSSQYVGGTIEFNESDINYGMRLKHNTFPDATSAEGLIIEGKDAGTYTPIATFDQNNKRVGIGTKVPVQRFHVHEPTASTGNLIEITNATTGANTTDGLKVGVTSTGQGLIRLDENQPLIFGTNNTEAMRIAPNLNVGIGVASSNPAGKLHVVTTSDSATNVAVGWSDKSFVVGRNGATGNGVGIGFDDTNNNGWIASMSPTNAWKSLFFNAQDYTWFSGGGAAAARLTNGACFGINTATPETLSRRLHIAESSGNIQIPIALIDLNNCGAPCGQGAGTNLMLRNNNTTDGNNGGSITFGNAQTNVIGAGIRGYNRTSTGMGLNFMTNGETSRMTLSTNGDLTLVSGIASKVGGGAWSVVSDKRLKENIVDYTSGLTEILKIKPVKFNYNDKSGIDKTKTFVGIIAQDIEKVLPDTVTKMADGSVKDQRQFDSSELTYTLINAIKELSAINAELVKRIEVLEGVKKNN